ncbi:sporulation inhibitor of replication protein SirA [Virgibacillus sp. NKC19-16]|uniref:sporulation inhibitor of replication protein SirA n=1 Tax=Virgibacillus salidurans TaxID=2831673 RepID=UPI001F3AFA02|nr:sporulation inhibitor of replication protein SirA [Virgibacillus sp. NKC19-16]UJL48017.1 sporulation inhibitor of replication protein SirA [Virgibacillus sp. NKC19-16]
MYEYSIFWIKEDVAKHYFYKSGILYRFMRDYQKNQNRADLKIQHDYIINRFPKNILISHIKRYCRENYIVFQLERSHIQLHKNKQLISLHISEKHLKFRCETLEDAEEFLFPMLRQFQPILFIIGNNIENYGWISPIPYSGNYYSEQVLYS